MSKSAKDKAKESAQKPESKRGRPSLFNEALSAKIIKLYSEGMTLLEVAENVGISPRTLDYWIADKEDFLRSIKKAASLADGIVEQSLFENAVKHMNVTAQIFWLKNRQPDMWRDKQSIETLGADGEPIAPTQVIVNIPSNGRDKKD